jgi:hypothetical protein
MNMLIVEAYRPEKDAPCQRFIRLRERRYFRSKIYEDTYIRKTQDLWLLGPAQCGKTRAIERLCERATEIWPKWPLLFLRATDPLTVWTDQEGLRDFCQEQGRDYKMMRSEERLKALLEWAGQAKLVLMIDDAQAVSGRKLVVAVRLAQMARLVVVGALSEQSMAPSLRTCLQRRAPQVVSMSSEAPYDATQSMMWLVLLLAMAAGWWELAAALSTVRALGRGPLAIKQH